MKVIDGTKIFIFEKKVGGLGCGLEHSGTFKK